MAGPVANEALEIAFAIGDRLLEPQAVARVPADPSTSLDNPGIAGYAGVAMLYAALLQVGEEPSYRRALHAYLKAAAEHGTTDGGLFAGLAGLAAASRYASIVEPRYAGLLQRAMSALASQACPSDMAGPGRHDLIGGPAGKAIACAYAASKAAARTHCDELAGAGDAARGRYVHPARPEDGPIDDLGMAHGAAGVVAALCIASERSQPYDAAIRRGADVLAAAGRFDSYGRDTWCYGAPGCAAALLLAAERLSDERYAATARAALRAMVEHPLEDHVAAIDDGLCHGKAGNGVILCLLGARTEMDDVCDYGAQLFGLLVDAYDESRPFGYRVPRAGGDIDAASLLEGASGIALALLTAAGACDDSWLRLFGLPSLGRRW